MFISCSCLKCWHLNVKTLDLTYNGHWLVLCTKLILIRYIEKKFDLSIINARNVDYSKADVYDNTHINPFERSMKVVNQYSDLPKLKFAPVASSLRAPSFK
jgi:hypothetical protein